MFTVTPLTGLVWINRDYILNLSGDTNSRTHRSQNSIVDKAKSSGGKNYWSVANASILPPSKNPHDYLSWAPYHWPNCNWCNSPSEPGFGPSNNLDSGSQFVSGSRRLRLVYRKAENSQQNSVDPAGSENLPTTISGPPAPVPTDIPDPDSGSTPFSRYVSMTTTSSSPTDVPHEKKPGSHFTTSKTSCTPSPTTSMAPSATWTTCPYVVRDGMVNSDVRTLNGPGAINGLSEAVISNAMAYAVTRSNEHILTVEHFLDFFFLKPETKMNPNMDFGQIVRGPGPEGRSGSFTGILDMRGLINICNAVLILDALKPSDWPITVTTGFHNWISLYKNWLDNSEIATLASSRPNNHGTFFCSQVAAAQLLAGDIKGAMNTLATFFQSKYLDQIAHSGEQPFEAIRTRPFHYRCFNLEALITNAKSGDQLGMDLWSARSKYGATIQTAVDYAMNIGSEGEDRTELFRHVMAVAAAYGEADGKYAGYLRQHGGDYESEPLWFYNQPEAVRRTRPNKQRIRGEEDLGRK